MTFDELIASVMAAPEVVRTAGHDLNRRMPVIISEALTVLGLAVDEGTGQIINVSKALPMAPPPPEWTPPEQRNVRYRGQVPRRRGKR